MYYYMFIIIGGNDMNKNIISFLNMKGGVCKTTLCKEIALYLSNNMNKKGISDRYRSSGKLHTIFF